MASNYLSLHFRPKINISDLGGGWRKRNIDFFYPFYSSDFISWLDSASIASLDHSHCYSNKEKHLALLHAGREARKGLWSHARSPGIHCSCADPLWARETKRLWGSHSTAELSAHWQQLPRQAESRKGKLWGLILWMGQCWQVLQPPLNCRGVGQGFWGGLQPLNT